MPDARPRRPVILAALATVAFAAILLPVALFGVRAAGPSLLASTSPSLLDRARLGTWTSPERTAAYVGKTSFQESDFIVVNGKYYLFSTSSADPAWVDVYVGNTPEDLLHEPPTFTHVAPIRYPSVVKDGNTWHMWGVNPPHKQTEHWISTNTNPTGFVYSDSPWLDNDHYDWAVVDFAVRKHPTNGYWYGIGFENSYNSALLLTRASSPNGPWERMNFERNTNGLNGIFGDTGFPPWADLARPDPNLAFTPDGRAWAFFTGNATTQAAYRPGMVEVNIETGKAIGNPVVLFDPQANHELLFTIVSDLNLVQVPGKPDYILGYTNNPQHPLGILSLADAARPGDGRTPSDLVRLNMARGLDIGGGMAPVKVRAPIKWGAPGLALDSRYSGAMGYLDSAYLSDFTFQVDFTPSAVSTSTVSTVAYIGGPDLSSDSDVGVQLDAAKGPPRITATVRGGGRARVILNSGLPARAGTRYSVVVRRTGSDLTLSVNGKVMARETYDAALPGLDSWSLGAQGPLSGPVEYPFLGTIHSFNVTGSGR